MAKNYVNIHNTSAAHIPQSEALPGSNQKKNNADGFSFVITPWQQLERFLIIGSDTGSYYVNAKNLTAQNAKIVTDLLATDGIRVVNMILDISDKGRAPKNAPAIYALALAAVHGNSETKKAAFANLPKIARTATDFFSFVGQYKALGGGFGSVAKKGIQNWYQSKDITGMAYQMVKYRQRDGWTHHDIQHLAHIKAKDDAENNLYAFAKHLANPDKNVKYDVSLLPNIAQGYLEAQVAKKAKDVVSLIEKYQLPFETIPTEFLSDPSVWEALLPHMKATALIRNLGRMTANGLIKNTSAAEKLVLSMLSDSEWIKKNRIHPMNVFLASKIYQQGHGDKGSLSWNPSSKVLTGLDNAFYGAFPNVTPTGKSFSISIDVSGSMSWSGSTTMSGVMAYEAAAAMSLITVAREPNVSVFAFNTGLKELDIHAKMRLDEVSRKLYNINGGGTDCALPFTHALKNKQKFDVFQVMTDNETWAGTIHPSVALQKYRKEMNIPAKSIVCAFAGTEFSIADPRDSGMMDISGLDANLPLVISDFVQR